MRFARGLSRTQTHVHTSWLIADMYRHNGRSGKFTDGCTYGCTDGRRDRSVALEKVRGAGPASSARWMVTWRVAHLVTGGRECRERDGSPGDCCAVATSLVVEASRVHPTGVGFSLFLPLSPLLRFPLAPSSPLALSCSSAPLLLPSSFIHLAEVSVSLRPVRSSLSASVLSLPLATLSHPVSPTMLPVSLSRRVALQKQAYGYPQ